MKKGKRLPMGISKQGVKRFLLYEARWQASTPILAVCLVWFASLGTVWATILANFVGSIIFFWIDRLIFTKHN